MSELREAYKKYSDRLDAILRDPTPQDLAALWPALPTHYPKPKKGDKLTVGDYMDFTEAAYRAKQKYEIIRLLMEVEKGNGQS